MLPFEQRNKFGCLQLCLSRVGSNLSLWSRALVLCVVAVTDFMVGMCLRVCCWCSVTVLVLIDPLWCGFATCVRMWRWICAFWMVSWFETVVVCVFLLRVLIVTVLILFVWCFALRVLIGSWLFVSDTWKLVPFGFVVNIACWFWLWDRRFGWWGLLFFFGFIWVVIVHSCAGLCCFVGLEMLGCDRRRSWLSRALKIVVILAF